MSESSGEPQTAAPESSGDPKPGGNAGEFVRHLPTDAKRVGRGDVPSIEPTPREQARLEPLFAAADPVDDRIAKYLAWRGSAFRIAATTGLIAVIFNIFKLVEAIGVANDLAADGARQNIQYGTDVLIFTAVLPFAAQGALVTCLILAALRWQRPRWTAMAVRRTWLVALLVPAVLTLLPVMKLLLPAQVHQLLEEIRWTDFTGEGGRQVDPQRLVQGLMLQAMTMVYALAIFLSAIPAVLSLFPGLLRATLMVKLLVPGRGLAPTVGGLAAPFYALLIIVVLSLVQQTIGSMVSLAGALCIVTGLIMFSRGMWALARPMDHGEAKPVVAGLRRRLLIVMGIGLVLLCVPVFTTRVFGKTLIGVGDDAMFQPWDLIGLVLWFMTMTLSYSVVACDSLIRTMREMDEQTESRRSSDHYTSEVPLVEALDALLINPGVTPGASPSHVPEVSGGNDEEQDA